MSGVSVELVNIAKYFGNRILFTDINATVHPGECLAVTGRNGSGKSTLLKTIAGFIRPSAGTISFSLDGRNLNAEQQAAVVSMVSPEVVFYQPLTAVENIQFLLQGRNKQLTLVQIETCLKQAGLAQHESKTVQLFSTGMRQRLKFALLMALDSPLLLLDEPSSNLDADGKRMVSEFICEALGRKKTIILASNEPWETDYGKATISLT